ncbi:NADH:flavin oxidoreductase/NADH oxidase [Mycena epipterygia]|nr:NADH:flavin oxidoreductase/NADH oxidase [Mycena epipterygia]
MSSKPVLFQSIQVGDVQLKHRVVLAPTTRFRSGVDHVPSPIMAEWYTQRGSAPGTLLIAEATFIARKAGGFRNVPGIWSPEQIAAWKKITDGVHSNGSFIFLQLWALGRRAYIEYLAPGDPLVSSSPKVVKSPMHQDAVPRTDDVPREMTLDEIKEYTELFAVAASNAVHKAGFDGVEIHGANGYLPEQFLMDSINSRTDSYGGSVENRARFPLEIIDAIVGAVGPTKTAIRLSPWNTKESGMADPKPTYAHLVTEIRDRHPKLAYIHLMEPPQSDDATISNDFIREIWGERALISAGGYSDTRESGFRAAEEKGDIIAYSRAFIANPDLPCRLLHGIPLIKGDGSKYYVYGSTDPAGYTDYPFHFTDLNKPVKAIVA